MERQQREGGREVGRGSDHLTFLQIRKQRWPCTTCIILVATSDGFPSKDLHLRIMDKEKSTSLQTDPTKVAEAQELAQSKFNLPVSLESVERGTFTGQFREGI